MFDETENILDNGVETVELQVSDRAVQLIIDRVWHFAESNDRDGFR